MLHTLVPSPTQFSPPFAGAGLLHVLVSVPPPQLLEHAPKSDHPPSSALSPVMPSAIRHMGWQLYASSIIRPSQASANHFYMKCSQPQNKHHSSFTPTSRTCTGLCVACADRIAYTIFAAICTCGVAACSLVSPAATRFRASAEPRPSSVQCTFASNTVCNAAQTSPTQFHVQYQQHN